MTVFVFVKHFVTLVLISSIQINLIIIIIYYTDYVVVCQKYSDSTFVKAMTRLTFTIKLNIASL